MLALLVSELNNVLGTKYRHCIASGRDPWVQRGLSNHLNKEPGVLKQLKKERNTLEIPRKQELQNRSFSYFLSCWLRDFVFLVI